MKTLARHNFKPIWVRLYAPLAAACLLAGCSPSMMDGLGSGGASTPEQNELAKGPPGFDANAKVTSADNDVTVQDSFEILDEQPNSTSSAASDGEPPAATDPNKLKTFAPCNRADFSHELYTSYQAALADPKGQTLPIAYFFSLGTLDDEGAYNAAESAILSKEHRKRTPIFAAPFDSLDASNYGGGPNTKVYWTDDSKAAEDYLQNGRCYFSEVKIVQTSHDAIHSIGNKMRLPDDPDPGAYNHGKNILAYGNSYSNQGIDTVSRRLFLPMEDHLKMIQNAMTDFNNRYPEDTRGDKFFEYLHTLPLRNQTHNPSVPLADFRPSRFTKALGGESFVNPDIASSTTRRMEINKSAINLFNLPEIQKNKTAVIKALREPATYAGYSWPGSYGATKLINQLVLGSPEGTLLAAQYTPIFLNYDVEDKDFGFSSLTAGTFFNMANQGIAGQPVRHLTSWIKGVRYQLEPPSAEYPMGIWGMKGTIPALVELKPALDSTGKAISCADGSPKYEVNGARDMMGTVAYVSGSNSGTKGRQYTFTNGFEKLRWLMQNKPDQVKPCTPLPPDTHYLTKEQVSDRWVTPQSIAFTKLGLFTDKNRDGIAECGEVVPVAQTEFAGINTCHIVSSVSKTGELAKDDKGNMTSIRAAFLRYPKASEHPAEVIETIIKGIDPATGTAGRFGTAIDVYFVGAPNRVLDRIDISKLAPLGP